MRSFGHKQRIIIALGVASVLFEFGFLRPLLNAEEGSADHSPTNMTVIVKDSETGAPISQAHITLRFQEPHGPTIPRKPKSIVYNAKTDTQGRYKFTGINKGPIVLMITSTGHQSYGKELALEKENQVFEIKLKKPQPLI